MSCINEHAIDKALDDWAAFILKDIQDKPEQSIALVGLISRGELLAQRLVQRLATLGCKAQYGAIDITLYRDDFSMQGRKPALRSSDLPFSTDGMKLILIDDVLHTGRTVRAALNAIFDYGRPASVEMHCLVNRPGREIPIESNYSCFTLSPKDIEQQRVEVQLKENHGADSITY
ncbi:MAG: bifunctional pyr operon transcriptional regulator/uracil phosphoribosyltransferase PyrR [Akkermansia sp.]